ncbi:MAG: class I adenylate-forming enzyme family protein [Ottowia sp.]|uniref:class I adenylate-forming enzyme family protein n=1 Tax=Ottowia sp. TaxID=1898956 RepID=UPI0039E4FC58
MIRNLGEVIPRDVAGDPSWLIEVGEGGATIFVSREEMHRQADAVALNLSTRGMARGTRVAIVAANSWRYLVAYLGIMRAGYTALLISPKFTAQTVAEICDDNAVQLIFADEEGAPKLEGKRFVRIDTDLGWESLLKFGEFRSVDMEPDEHATILFTSGSAGKPKGVPLTHAGYVWAISTLGISGPPVKDRRVLVAAPLFHMNALVICLLTGHAGGTTVLMKRFNAADYLKAAAGLRCQLLTSVPTMLALAARETEVLKQVDLSHVDSIFTGSSPSTEALFERVGAMFPNARVLNGYGTTEGGPVVFGPHPKGLPRPRLSLGYPAPGVEWRLADGQLPRQGVFQMRCKAVMPGYLNLPGETERRLRDGWYDTGDVLQHDNDGFFYFVGRSDDMFVCGGENIYPGEVEKLLESHPAVGQAVVVPVADEIKGRLPAAFIVLKPGSSLDVEEVKQYALSKAPAYQHPRFVAFLQEIPLAGPNKVDRKHLIQTANAIFNR